jgi:ubiquinone/menaquinone biosynthesis C-methylase UbiE
MNYNPESYWSTIGQRIKERQEFNVIAGDDEPYYRYKRKKFLELLESINFHDKSVLEVGCGPGGNLIEILKKKPSKLAGVDISNEMISLAKERLPSKVELFKSDGKELPFSNKSFDIVFTATVLQHNTNPEMLNYLIKEICRIGTTKVAIFERIENKVTGDELCEGRPVDFYKSKFESYGFKLVDKRFINIGVSYYISGAIRKVFNPSNRAEGEPITKISELLQKLTLPITKLLDYVYRPKRDLAKLEFERIEN